MRVFLIRHASVDAIGKWAAGRGQGLHLTEQGQMEAEALARRLAAIAIDAIYSSPLERTQETAQPLARSKELPIVVCEELTDIDFGQWTGRQFSELHGSAEWHRFNSQRSRARIPGGESMLDVLHRMIGEIELLHEKHTDQSIAVFSHCDPIRAAIAHYLGMNLDGIRRIVISPASISVMDVGECGARMLALNSVCNDFVFAQD